VNILCEHFAFIFSFVSYQLRVVTSAYLYVEKTFFIASLCQLSTLVLAITLRLNARARDVLLVETFLGGGGRPEPGSPYITDDQWGHAWLPADAAGV